MKTGLIATAIMVVLSAEAKEAPTKAQIQQLFESVFHNELTAKLHIVSIHETSSPPPSPSVIKKDLDNTKQRAEKLQEGVSEPQRTMYINEELRLRLLTLTGTEIHKIEEWKSGSLYRLDKAYAPSLEEADKKTNYDTSYINLIDVTNGAISSVTVNHDTKSFETRFGKHASWTEVGAWNAINAEPKVQFIVALALASPESIQRKGKDKKQRLALDPLKLQKIISGNDPVFNISLDKGTMEGQQIRAFAIEVRSPKQPTMKGTVLVELDDKDQVVYTEIKDKEGTVTLRSTRNEFDSQGFPHEYTLMEELHGTFTTNIFITKSVELNAQFSDDEVFRFAPPAQYGVVDMSGDKPKVLAWPGNVKPVRIIDLTVPLKQSSWFGHPFLIRWIVFTVLFVPLVIMLFIAMKKRSSTEHQ
jgi:hypothetical protein